MYSNTGQKSDRLDVISESRHGGSGGRSNISGILFVQISKTIWKQHGKEITNVQSMFQSENTGRNVFHILRARIFKPSVHAVCVLEGVLAP